MIIKKKTRLTFKCPLQKIYKNFIILKKKIISLFNKINYFLFRTILDIFTMINNFENI